MIIDKETGNITTLYGYTVRPSLTLSEWNRSELANVSQKDIVGNQPPNIDGWFTHVHIPAFVRDMLRVATGLSFDNRQIYSASLRVVREEDVWADESPSGITSPEFERKAGLTQAKFLMDELGDKPYSFPWGLVTFGPDPHHGQHSIYIRYRSIDDYMKEFADATAEIRNARMAAAQESVDKVFIKRSALPTKRRRAAEILKDFLTGRPTNT